MLYTARCGIPANIQSTITFTIATFYTLFVLDKLRRSPAFAMSLNSPPTPTMKPNIAILVFLPGRFESPQVWRLEVPAVPPVDAAEQAFKLSNAPEEFLNDAELAILEKFPREGIRSISVGDILVIQDDGKPEVSHYATVEGCGHKFHSLNVQTKLSNQQQHHELSDM